MWSKLKPLCTLYEWADVIGIHPYLVAQIGEPREQLSYSFGQCENPFYQQAHARSDALGRDDVAEALLNAQDLICKFTNTMPAPFAHSEDVIYPREANLRLGQLWMGSSGRMKPVKTRYANLIAVGVYEETLIEADAAIVATDPYSDGFNTLATVTVNVPAGTDESEVVCFFSSGDIPAPLSREDCEIRPVSVSISGNVATITFPLVLAVLIANFLKLVPVPLDATDTIYATTVDVYRRTVDLTQAGTLIWETGIPCDTPPCTVSISTGCFRATNARQGYVTPVPAEYDDAEAEWVRLYPDTPYAPDRVTVNYICGVPRIKHQLNPIWKDAVAKLATALLPNKSLGCAYADLRLSYYRNLPTRDDGSLEVTQSMLNAASAVFGTAGRGAVQAYAKLNDPALRIGRSMNE